MRNYVEPFCGSAAVLLGRPDAPQVETVNDANCFISNFWRAMAADPDAVANFADWPINEADLHARHKWLMTSGAAAEWRERMKTDPEYCDAKIAGWWAWGACCWIASGWCSDASFSANKRPVLQPETGVGVTSISGAQYLSNKLPCDARPRALVSGASHRPHLGRPYELHASKPHLTHWRGGAFATGEAPTGIAAWFRDLSDRLRRVRVCCGDWSRVVTPAVTDYLGVTGIFLDPPYADTAGRAPDIYAVDCLDVAHQVRKWAITNGDNPKLRIALCGYEGEHVMPDSWPVFSWATQGGYGHGNKEGKALANRVRERIWFSPHCLAGRQADMFAEQA